MRLGRRTGVRSTFTAVMLVLTLVMALAPVVALACHTLTFKGTKFEDINGDGTFNTDEPRLAGWTITVEGYTNAGLTTKKTDCDVNDDGKYK
ncbi:MAG: hypothetical protein ACUVWR_18345 [Anaerolineae bacterium]